MTTPHAKSMTRRLTLELLALVAGLWIIGITFAAVSIRHEIDEVFDSALQETAERILPLAARDVSTMEQSSSTPDTLPGAIFDDGHGEYITYQVRDKTGRVLLRSHDASATPFDAPLRRGFHDDGEKRIFTEHTRDESLFIQVAENPEERHEAVVALWVGLATPLVALLLLAAALIPRRIQATTAPLRSLQNEIKARDGRHLAPLPLTELPAELLPIATDLNRLLDRLERALDTERATAAMTAHELRNPLAAAIAQADVIRAQSQDAALSERAKALSGLLNSLGRRTEKILQLARAEAGIGLTRESTDLAAVTTLIVEDYKRKPTLASRLRYERPDAPCRVSLDADAIGIIVQNLIDNAVSHAEPDTPITIALNPDGSLCVTNAAPAISPETLATLTERFKRAPGSDARGSGLGLAIVETILQQAGGRLTLASPPPGHPSGFEARVTFPKA